jgi:hypothetical protein
VYKGISRKADALVSTCQNVYSNDPLAMDLSEYATINEPFPKIPSPPRTLHPYSYVPAKSQG